MTPPVPPIVEVMEGNEATPLHSPSSNGSQEFQVFQLTPPPIQVETISQSGGSSRVIVTPTRRAWEERATRSVRKPMSVQKMLILGNPMSYDDLKLITSVKIEGKVNHFNLKINF
jgi:hypothetical protein